MVAPALALSKVEWVPPAVAGASRPLVCGQCNTSDFLRKVVRWPRDLCQKGAYSMMTVDCPEISNRFRQRMFLQAIMSSFRTI